MNALCEFVMSIGDDRIMFLVDDADKEEFPLLINNNYTNLKNVYRKLKLYIDYCYTDNEQFKIALECIYNRYCEAFEDFGNGIAIIRRIEELESECENAKKDANDKIANYTNIMTDQKIKDDFFNQLYLLIKNETNYIKGK